jgi:hypothetical protein
MKSLLVVGHPGHELRILGWVAQTRPAVCILTDGSGSDEAPHLEPSLQLLRSLGALPNTRWGELNNRRLYEHILEQEYAPFEALARRLAQVLLDQEIEAVVSDGIEGYHPVHDLCEVLVSTAVALARRRGGRPVGHSTFALMGDPRRPAGFPRLPAGEVNLTEEGLRRKREAMVAYASSAALTLQREIEDTLRNFGEGVFRREYFFGAVTPGDGWERRFEHEKPFYEIYGEKQLAAGRYPFIIRFREHLLPLTSHLSALGLSGAQVAAVQPLRARIAH